MIDTYFNKVSDTLDRIDRESISRACELIRYCKGNIFVFGNGGSAATASHFAQDMNKMMHLRFICLNDNIPSILAYGNDDGFYTIFVSQLERLIKEGDLIIGISCSGNSKNVIDAVTHANYRGCNTIGITGFDGGQLKLTAKQNIHVPCNNMQICEDVHLIITHVILKLLSHDT